MRIGFSTSVIQRGKTGIAQYVFALLRALAREPSQHQIILFVLEDDLPLFQQFGSTLQIFKVPEVFRSPLKNILWHQMELPRLARRLALDVLHIPSYRRLLWSRPCPLVGTVHDLAPFRVPHKYDWKRMFYGRVVVRRLARRQDRIIAISENTARDLEQFFGLSNQRVSVIHNGVEHHRFFPANQLDNLAEIRRNYSIERPFFLYVARFEHPGKNHLRLLAAYERFKQSTRSPWLLVLGGTDWHGAEAIHRAIDNSPHRSDIRCLGFVPDSSLPDLYRAAGGFVFPSLYEGFGMPPIEAMACGCPVICSDRGSLAEVVGNAAAIVDPEDVDSIASQLRLVATFPEIRETLRQAGLINARKFDWCVTAGQTLGVYKQAAGMTESNGMATTTANLTVCAPKAHAS
jgi:glycosyltransferase involved in cell wall biosynthesis